MFEEPLFQPHILSTMLRYFAYYFSYGNWIWQYLGAMLVIYGVYKFVTYKNVVTYPKFFPDALPKEPFQKRDWWSVIFLLCCLGGYIVALYSQEMSFFQNYDTMSTNTLSILRQGVTPMFGGTRFAPVAFWEVNLIYALSHNFYIVNIFIVFQVFIILTLLYIFLDFLSQSNRFIVCALFFISPSFFGINNIIFPERMLLIYFISSLIFLKKYNRTPQKSYFLFFGIMCANLAMYTKETTILIYFGILIYFFLYHLWNENITIKSFIHPLKITKQFPVETLFFLSMVFYTVFYFYYVFDMFNTSLQQRQATLFEIIITYKFEIFIILISFILFLNPKKHAKAGFLGNACLVGSLFQIGCIIFVFNLVPFRDYLYMEVRTYYCILCYTIALIYLIANSQNKILKTVLSFMILIHSLINNWHCYHIDEGRYYKEVAIFITEQKTPILIYLSEHSEPNPWSISAWLSIYKYYWPQKNIKFYTNAFSQNIDMMLRNYSWKHHPELYQPFEYQEYPISGNFYVVKYPSKNIEDKEILKNIDHKKVFSNKFFEVYYIK